MTDIDRRAFLVAACLAAASRAGASRAGASEDGGSLAFGELYGKVSVLGLEFSEKLRGLDGRAVRMKGFIAPPLKAEANFFVLTQRPMAPCPSCSSDADWPADIVVVYLDQSAREPLPSRVALAYRHRAKRVQV